MGQATEGVVQLMYWSWERATRTGRVATKEPMMAVDGLDAFDESLVVSNLGVSKEKYGEAFGDGSIGQGKWHVKKRTTSVRDPLGSKSL
jgi:hypothetical protein